MMPANTTDEDLAHRACGGDQPAMEELFIRHQARLRALVARSLSDPEDVIDVVQDAFVDVLRGLHTWEPGRPFLPWMRVVTRNRLFRFLRDRRRRGAVALEEALDPTDASTGPDWDGDEIGLLAECIAALGEPARRLVRWRYRDGLPMANLAARCDRSDNAVMVQLHRIRATLRACLQRKGVTA